MVSWKNKMKIIWKILFLKGDKVDIETNECIDGYKVIDTLRPNPCDNHWKTGCLKQGEYCLSRTFLKINVSLECEDHVHVCESCAKKLLAKTHDFR